MRSLVCEVFIKCQDVWIIETAVTIWKWWSMVHVFSICSLFERIGRINVSCIWFRNKPGHPHFWFHEISHASHHCSPQKGSRSLTIGDRGALQLLGGATADEHWRSGTLGLEETVWVRKFLTSFLDFWIRVSWWLFIQTCSHLLRLQIFSSISLIFN